MMPSNVGDGLIPMSKCSNLTSYMIHMYMEIDDEDYNCIYQSLFDSTCMFSIGCTPMIIITFTWLKLD
jgi:hypothetical protein